MATKTDLQALTDFDVQAMDKAMAETALASGEYDAATTSLLESHLASLQLASFVLKAMPVDIASIALCPSFNLGRRDFVNTYLQASGLLSKNIFELSSIIAGQGEWKHDSVITLAAMSKDEQKQNVDFMTTFMQALEATKGEFFECSYNINNNSESTETGKVVTKRLTNDELLDAVQALYCNGTKLKTVKYKIVSGYNRIFAMLLVLARAKYHSLYVNDIPSQALAVLKTFESQEALEQYAIRENSAQGIGSCGLGKIEYALQCLKLAAFKKCAPTAVYSRYNLCSKEATQNAIALLNTSRAYPTLHTGKTLIQVLESDLSLPLEKKVYPLADKWQYKKLNDLNGSKDKSEIAPIGVLVAYLKNPLAKDESILTVSSFFEQVGSIDLFDAIQKAIKNNNSIYIDALLDDDVAEFLNRAYLLIANKLEAKKAIAE